LRSCGPNDALNFDLIHAFS